MRHSNPLCYNGSSVLGLARTEFIFTGIQEGEQPGGLTPPGQTEQGIPYHVLPCWVLVAGGAGRREGSCGSGPRAARAVRVALCILLFVLCILLFCVVVVTVPLVCCSVKLP